MKTGARTRWDLARTARITALAILSALGSVIISGWLGLVFSLTSIGLAIAGTLELRHARQARAVTST